MIRSAAKVVVFLLLGAIVNVAVAWGCAMMMMNDRSVNFPDSQIIRVKRQIGLPDQSNAWGMKYISFGWSFELISHDTNGMGRLGNTGALFHNGWPCKALQGSWIMWENGSVATTGLTRIGQRNYLPLRPIWPGFAINTIFYAAMLWVTYATPFALRRRLRARRGLCPACAYPVGTSPVCTECGAAVSSICKAGPDETA